MTNRRRRKARRDDVTDDLFETAGERERRVLLRQATALLTPVFERFRGTKSMAIPETIEPKLAPPEDEPMSVEEAMVFDNERRARRDHARTKESSSGNQE